MTIPAALQGVRLQKTLLFLVGLAPLVYLVVSIIAKPPADPYERIAHVTGEWALRLLLLTLLVTPVIEIFKVKRIGVFRRTLGVLCFVYACAHFFAYISLEAGFDFGFFIDDLVERRYIVAGALAFFLMVPLALTSNNFSVCKLCGSRWKKLHKLVFPVVLLACLHFFLQVRGNPTEPLIYTGIAVALIGYRLVRWRKRRKACNAALQSHA